jgi:hypothetical protein
MELRAMKRGGEEPSFASLIERSAELKRALVDFACSPRLERQLARFMLEAADPEGNMDEGEAIGIVDGGGDLRDPQQGPGLDCPAEPAR